MLRWVPRKGSEIANFLARDASGLPFSGPEPMCKRTHESGGRAYETPVHLPVDGLEDCSGRQVHVGHAQFAEPKLRKLALGRIVDLVNQLQSGRGELFAELLFELCLCLATGVQCGTIGDRIVGGKPVDITNFPYQVSLVVYDLYHICGGSIISESWVLTAAHCIGEEDIKVRAGSSFRNEGGKIFDVKKIIVHDNYGSLDYDIALLQIQGSFINQGIPANPIALPAPNQIYPGGTVSVVSGWGNCLNTCSDSYRQLQAVEVPIVDHEKCQYYYQDRYDITS
ncbi:hypothetical protein Trydic_g10011, partial [Trypoxylus dichotomus]